MKVFIKNKLFSMGGSSEVFDEANNPIFKVEGGVASPTRRKEIYDTNGKLLYIVRNRFFNFFANKVYIFDSNENLLATIKKGKWSINAVYKIEDCADNMSIEGKIFSRTSTILRNGKPVGVITREFAIAIDSFTLEAEEQDIPFLTALVIAFDNMKDKIQKDD